MYNLICKTNIIYWLDVNPHRNLIKWERLFAFFSSFIYLSSTYPLLARLKWLPIIPLSEQMHFVDIVFCFFVFI